MAKYKYIIAHYLQFCQDNNYEWLFESSLYRILKESKPSQRKSLARLDNTTADGLNGFSILADIVKKYLAGNKGMVDKLERGKWYLKIGYPSILLSILIISLLLYWTQLIQIYTRRDNKLLNIKILFVINAVIYIHW